MELPNQKTPLSVADGLKALALGWKLYFGAPPEEPTRLYVIAAQTILETGWFQSMHCYNFGNVKASPSGTRDFTYYACNEVLPQATADAFVKRSTPDAPCVIKGHDSKGNALVYFYPKHPVACFRAFQSAEQGACDHLAVLNSDRYAPCWPAVDAGRVEDFVRGLKHAGYYTADEDAYARAAIGIFQKIRSVPFELDPMPAVPEQLAIMASILRDQNARDDAQPDVLAPLRDMDTVPDTERNS